MAGPAPEPTIQSGGRTDQAARFLRRPRSGREAGRKVVWCFPPLAETAGDRARRAANVLFCLGILVVAAPVMALVALAVWLEDGGPILYRQERVGRRIGSDGGSRAGGERDAGPRRTFVLYKFRSMRTDAESRTGPVWSDDRDPRVTRVGRWIRSLHLDELPQLWNVLRGDMNLVGPRPERPEFVELLCRKVPRYPHRLAVRPGLTGLAQLRQGTDRDVADVERKVRHDLEYLRRRSIRLDAWLLLATPFVVLGRLARRPRLGPGAGSRVGQPQGAA